MDIKWTYKRYPSLMMKGEVAALLVLVRMHWQAFRVRPEFLTQDNGRY